MSVSFRICKRYKISHPIEQLTIEKWSFFEDLHKIFKNIGPLGTIKHSEIRVSFWVSAINFKYSTAM